MKQIVAGSIIVGIISIASVAYGATAADVIASFRSVATISVPALRVPTVVDIPLPTYIDATRHIGLYNVTENIFTPFDVLQQRTNTIGTTISAYGVQTEMLAALADGRSETSVDFMLDEEVVGSSVMTLRYTFDEPIRSDTLHMMLDQYVVRPENVSIRALAGGVMQRMAARIVPDANTVTFPEVTASVWEVTLEYKQPLRFAELVFINKNNQPTSTTVRFLAHPDAQYELYHMPEVLIAQDLGERSELRSARDVVTASVLSNQSNPRYLPADTDADGVIDAEDNCPRHANADQVDVDGNSRGDACDDFDRDGVVNSNDNCTDLPNRDQADIDRDGVGDACDADESRITEKYPWLVWLALGLAVAVFAVLFVFAVRHHEEEEPAQMN